MCHGRRRQALSKSEHRLPERSALRLGRCARTLSIPRQTGCAAQPGGQPTSGAAGCRLMLARHRAAQRCTSSSGGEPLYELWQSQSGPELLDSCVRTAQQTAAQASPWAPDNLCRPRQLLSSLLFWCNAGRHGVPASEVAQPRGLQQLPCLPGDPKAAGPPHSQAGGAISAHRRCVPALECWQETCLLGIRQRRPAWPIPALSCSASRPAQAAVRGVQQC